MSKFIFIEISAAVFTELKEKLQDAGLDLCIDEENYALHLTEISLIREATIERSLS